MKVYNIKYIIKAGKHVATYRPIKLWCCKKQYDMSLIIEKGWYRKDELDDVDGVSKLRGISFGIHAENPFGKIWPFKYLVNSIVIGAIANPTYRTWDLYHIVDSNGEEKRYKIGEVKEGDKIEVSILRHKDRVRVDYPDKSFMYYLRGLPFGYYLNSYFGGKSTAVRTVVINTQLISK